MLPFADRVAVITGSGRGLGRAHAHYFANLGASVVVNDLGAALDGMGRSPAPADAVTSEILETGGRAIASYEDVSTVDGGEALIADALEHFGRLDILVNNAGILRDAPMVSMQATDWDAVIDVHLRGAFCVTRPAWAQMAKQKYGRIVNTSSDSGLFGTAGHANYAAVKMALVGFTKTLALEGRPLGINANVVAPIGLSRMTSLPDTSNMRNETVSATVAWLAHENCKLTGEILSVRRDRVARVVVGINQGYSNGDMDFDDLVTNQQKVMDLKTLRIPEIGGR